jgi:hypothetical protein
VITLDRRVLDCAIHALDLAVRPRMVNFRQPVLNLVLFTDAIKQMLESPLILYAVGELDATVSQDDIEAIGYGSDQPADKLTRRGGRPPAPA